MKTYHIDKNLSEAFVKKRLRRLYPVVAGLVVITILAFWFSPNIWLTLGMVLLAGGIYGRGIFKSISILKQDSRQLYVRVDSNKVTYNSQIKKGEIPNEGLGFESLDNGDIKIYHQANSLYELGNSKTDIFVIPKEIENRDLLLEEIKNIAQQNLKPTKSGL